MVLEALLGIVLEVVWHRRCTYAVPLASLLFLLLPPYLVVLQWAVGSDLESMCSCCCTERESRPGQQFFLQRTLGEPHLSPELSQPNPDASTSSIVTCQLHVLLVAMVSADASTVADGQTWSHKSLLARGLWHGVGADQGLQLARPRRRQGCRQPVYSHSGPRSCT